MNPPLDSNSRDPELDEELPPGCPECGEGWDVCVCPDVSDLISRVSAYLHEYVEDAPLRGRSQPCATCHTNASKIVWMCKTYLEEQ